MQKILPVTLVLLAVFGLFAYAPKAYAIYVATFQAQPSNVINYGSGVRLAWYVSGANGTRLYDFPVYAGYYPGGQIANGYNAEYGQYDTPALYTSKSYWVEGQDNRTTNYAYAAAAITIYVKCSQPWDGGSYLLYPGGSCAVYPAGGGRYGLTNYSGNYILVPVNSPAQWSAFYNAAGGVGVGINAF